MPEKGVCGVKTVRYEFLSDLWIQEFNRLQIKPFTCLSGVSTRVSRVSVKRRTFEERWIIYSCKKVNNLYVLATKVFIFAIKCRAVALLWKRARYRKCLFGFGFPGTHRIKGNRENRDEKKFKLFRQLLRTWSLENVELEKKIEFFERKQNGEI